MKIILKEYKTLWKTTSMKKPGYLIPTLLETIITIIVICFISFNKSLVINDVKIDQLLFQIPIAFFGINFLWFVTDIRRSSFFMKNELIIFSKIYEKRLHHFLIEKFLFYVTICFIHWFFLIILLLSIQRINNYFIIIWYLFPVIFIPFFFVGINALIIKLNLLKKYKLSNFIYWLFWIQGLMSFFMYYPNLLLNNKSSLEILNYFAPFFYIIYLQVHTLTTIDFYAIIPFIYYVLIVSAFIIWLVAGNKKKGNLKWDIKL